MAPNLSTLRPLRTGSVVFDIKPILYIIDDNFKGRHCDHCLQYSTVLEICLDCHQMYYCDKDCRIRDWEYHRMECPLMASQEYQTNCYNWIERLLIRLWLCLTYDPNFATKRYGLVDGTEVSLKDIEVKHNKEDEQIDRKVFDRNNKEDNKRIQSYYEINYMFEFNLICKHFEDYGLDFDRKELFRWYEVIAGSAVSYSFKWYSEDVFIGANEFVYPAIVGHGLYPQLWSVGHSCAPNVAIVTNGLSLQLRAMTDIGVGTDITRNYVPINQNKIERKAELKNLYFFDCNCVKCKQLLDSDINYREYELKIKVLENNFDLNEMYCNPKMEEWMYFFETMRSVVKMEKKMFGGYHPSLTDTLMRQMVALRWWGRIERHTLYWIPWECETKYRKIEQHLRITHGIYHPLYKKYFRERTSLL